MVGISTAFAILGETGTNRKRKICIFMEATVIREYFETYRNSAEEFRQERGGGGKQIITGRRCGMGGKV